MDHVPEFHLIQPYPAPRAQSQRRSPRPPRTPRLCPAATPGLSLSPTRRRDCPGQLALQLHRCLSLVPRRDGRSACPESQERLQSERLHRLTQAEERDRERGAGSLGCRVHRNLWVRMCFVC